MSTVLAGNAANVTTPLAATVSTTTGNAVSPIVVTTTANHLYASGDYVSIAGVTGNTAANGTWTITVTGATTFSLNGSTGNGGYGGGGTCVDNSLTPQTTIPSDGDVFAAASFNVAYTTLADRTQFLARQAAALPDLTTLAASVAPTDGTMRHVLGFGWYVFKSSATTGLSPFRVAATDSTTGGWVVGAAHQTTLIRQAPIGYRVQGITNGSSGGSTPASIAPVLTASFMPPSGADISIVTSSMYPCRTNTGSTNCYGYLVDINDSMLDGATLVSATLRFGAFGHGTLPTRQPSFGIVRQLTTGVSGTQSNLLSTGGGLVALAAGTVGAYNGAQALVYTPDSNQVVDRTAYHYSAIIFDEAGTGAGAGALGILGCGYQAIELSLTMPDGRR